MSRRLRGLVLVLVVTCGACGGDTETRTVTVTQTVTAPPATTEPATAPDAQDAPAASSDDVGKTVRSGGIKLKVVSTRSARSLQMLDDYGEPTRTLRAKQGGRYVVVKTRLTNDAARGIDLTCSYEVDAKLLDAEDRQFDPIDSLYEVPGNPECNEMLQPGFKTTMTWVYLVSPGSDITTFAFVDVTDPDEEAEPAFVTLPAAE